MTHFQGLGAVIRWEETGRASYCPSPKEFPLHRRSSSHIKGGSDVEQEGCEINRGKWDDRKGVCVHVHAGLRAGGSALALSAIPKHCSNSNRQIIQAYITAPLLCCSLHRQCGDKHRKMPRERSAAKNPSVLSYIHISSAVLAKADRCPDIILPQPIQ